MIANTLASLSLIGIWPRFVEPSWLEVTSFDYALKGLASTFEGFRILHISDLHFADKPTRALKETAAFVQKTKPDCIVFTGDFLCYSRLEYPEELKKYLCKFQAPYGSFAVLGNHDYSSYVSFGSHGESVILDKKLSLLSRFSSKPVPDNLEGEPNLLALLQETPFQLLPNATKQVAKGGSFLNITGLGDFFAKDTRPEIAFAGFDHRFPGIVLCHNPVSTKVFTSYPGELILAGHTHGSQFNIPLLRNLLLQDKHMRRGLVDLGDKKLYISRGMGSHIHFRLFSRPEITLITLHGRS